MRMMQFNWLSFDEEQNVSSLTRLLLVSLVLLAAILRLYDLGEESLWNDELSSWSRSNYDRLSEVVLRSKGDVHPPGYQILLYFVIRSFGESEIALRAISAIAGIASVPAIYFLGKRLYDARVGIIAASLLTVQWSAIYYSQEGRVYAALLLFTIVASLLWVMIFLPSQDKEYKISWLVIISYAAAALILAYLHYFGLLIVLLQGASALLIAVAIPRHRVAVCAISAVFLLGYAPWMPSLFNQLAGDGDSWIVPPSIFVFIGAQLRFAFGFFFPVYLIFILFFFVLTSKVFFGRGAPLQDIRRKWSTVFVFLWGAATAFLVFVFSIAIMPIWTTRNLIVVSPAAYIAVAFIIASIPKRRTGNALAAILMVLSTVELVLIDKYYTQPQKEQFREIAAHVCEEAQAEPIFYLAWSDEYFRYYMDDFCINYQLLGPFGSSGILESVDDDIDTLSSELQAFGAERFWFINGHRRPSQQFLARLEELFVFQDERRFIGGSARRFKMTIDE